MLINRRFIIGCLLTVFLLNSPAQAFKAWPKRNKKLVVSILCFIGTSLAFSSLFLNNAQAEPYKFALNTLNKQQGLSHSDQIYLMASQGDITHLRNLENEDLELKNPDEFGYTPLFYALKNGQIAAAEVLLEKHVQAGIEAENGDTPLLIAVQTGALTSELLTKLIKNGAMIEHVHEQTGMTAAMHAAQLDQLTALELLVDFGANLDRINIRNGKGLWDYAQEPRVIKFLQKNHAYFSKTLKRFGYKFIYDPLGFPHEIGQGSEGVVYLVEKNKEIKAAKFFYDVESFKRKKNILYMKRWDTLEEVLTHEWEEWFGNPLSIESFDLFFVKTYIPGKSLAHWMSGVDVPDDLGAESNREVLDKLKELLIRMLKDGRGFVGDLNASNLIFHDTLREWVVIDGDKNVACYALKEHMWVWTEYCSVNSKLTSEQILQAFKTYAVGSFPHAKDKDNAGIWLQNRVLQGKYLVYKQRAKDALTAMVQSL
jgi:hypothetical protein